MRPIIEQKLNKETECKLAAEFASMIFEDIQKYIEEHMEEFTEWQTLQENSLTVKEGA